MVALFVLSVVALPRAADTIAKPQVPDVDLSERPTKARRILARPGVRTGAVAAGVFTTILLVGTWTGLLPWTQLFDTCPSGRTCVPAAGISLVLPVGWRAESHQGHQLTAVTEGHREELLISDGAALLDEPMPEDLDAVERAGLARLHPRPQPGTLRLTVTTFRAVDRVTLPTGPAVLVVYETTTNLAFYHTWSITEHWLFVDGRLICIQYAERCGEVTPSGPIAVSPDLRSILDSLRRLSTEPT